MASAGIGSGPHVAGELFKMMAAVNTIHVPYRGQGPALTDLLGGQVQFYFAGVPSSIQYFRSAKLRVLAVTTGTRSQPLPEIPTLSDFLPGYEASFWGGFCAPKSTPAEVIETLNRKINAALSDPRMQARLGDLGATPFGGSPADFGKHIAEETEKRGKVIRAEGGILYIWNARDNTPIASQPIAPGDDVEFTARRLLREKSGRNSFNQPINYPKRHYH